MDHKMMVARNLREGLERIQRFCIKEFEQNPLNDQWWCLRNQIVRGVDFEQSKRLTEDQFARRSFRLLRRIVGD